MSICSGVKRRETDSRIEPIACGEQQWEEDNSSVILEMARREGERIVLEETPSLTTAPGRGRATPGGGR